MTQQSTDIVLVTTVVDERGVVDRIVEALVPARLAACVQVSGPVTSTYWWEGEVESAEEYAVAAKVPAALAEAAVAAIVAAHSYDVPEVLVTPVLGGHRPYVDWVLAEASATPSS
jgi:periplasmic divalent cation tolerance protein